MLILYQVVLSVYWVLILMVSKFNKKAKKLVLGQRNLFQRIEQFSLKKPIWVHAASLGEFEQGRPIIERIKATYPNEQILLTFFSPSGYEVRKNYQLADEVCYLPLDSPKNASRFIDWVKPKLAIFIKYEFWYYYLFYLNQRTIPILMISCIFRSNQFFFHRYGKFLQNQFRQVKTIYVQDAPSAVLIGRIASNVQISGDTRFDRVTEIAQEAKSFPQIDKFVGNHPVFVFGSIWQSDLEKISNVIKQLQSSFKIIIAPHHTDAPNIKTIRKQFQNVITFSSAQTNGEIMLIDNIGMLSALYKYGKYAYIGGAFRGALHNTLEAAVYGIPVFFGKHRNNAKFREVLELVERGGAFEIENESQLREYIETLEIDKKTYKAVCQSNRSFVQSKTGATDLIMRGVAPFI